MSMHGEFNYSDFTEEHYNELITIAKKKYKFIKYGEVTHEPHLLWRHDIDMSPQRAVKLAKIEHDQGVTATYLLLMHSEFYNLFEPEVIRCINDIISMGHDIGLHFDSSIYSSKSEADIERHLINEKLFIESVFKIKINVFSFHNPDVGGCLDKDKLGGMINTYGKSLMESYKYCSDSNGYWRYDRLYDVLSIQQHEQLQILTHPCWWTSTAMSPRERITRCIEGRKNKVANNYDKFMSQQEGRINVGVKET